jgi:DNA repair protein RadC
VPAGLRLSSAQDVWNATRDIHEALQEHAIAFDLNVRHRIIARRVIGIGSICGVEVHPREVFRQAIANGAAAVLLVHNHPSADHAPSRQDIDLTRRLREVGDICGIPLLDHVVVASTDFTSIAQLTS